MRTSKGEIRKEGGVRLGNPVRRPLPQHRAHAGSCDAAEIDAFKIRGLEGEALPLPPDREPVLTPGGRRLADAIRAAYETDDWGRLQPLVARAHASSEAGVRAEMVWALDWFGSRALPEIVSFLNDADPEIASDAFNAWESALSEMEDDMERLKVAELVLKTGAPKEVMESAALEYADMEDRPAIESLVRIISANAPGAEQARERYEIITGKPYVDATAAQTWLNDFASDETP